MPKNKGKGGKNRRRGKNENEGLKRELVFKEDGQEYAQVRDIIHNTLSYTKYFPHQVTKMLGNGRLEAMCFDGVKRLCHIRGKLRKKVWINQSDIILVGLRDYQVIYSILSISLFSMLFPSGRQGRRHSQIFRRRGEKPEIIRRVSRVHQDHGHC